MRRGLIQDFRRLKPLCSWPYTPDPLPSKCDRISERQARSNNFREQLVRLRDDLLEIVVRRRGTAAVSGLAWNATGTLLAFATEDGDAGLLNL